MRMREKHQGGQGGGKHKGGGLSTIEQSQMGGNDTMREEEGR